MMAPGGAPGGEVAVFYPDRFVADRSNNRVQVWNRIEDAIGGKPADAFLGAADAGDRRAGLGRNKLLYAGFSGL